jgi:hypothetical protein
MVIRLKENLLSKSKFKICRFKVSLKTWNFKKKNPFKPKNLKKKNNIMSSESKNI